MTINLDALREKYNQLSQPNQQSGSSDFLKQVSFNLKKGQILLESFLGKMIIRSFYAETKNP